MSDELMVPIPSDIIVADLVSEWLTSIDATDDTRQTYRRGLAAFLSWLGEQPATAKRIRRWRDDLRERYAPETVNTRLTAVRSFYAWAVDSGRILANPAVGVKGAKRRGTSTAHKRDALTPSEVRAVLEACDPAELAGARDRAMISLAAYCGLRVIELYRANVADLGVRGERAILWVFGKGRAGRDEFAVLPEAALSDLRRWLKVRPGDPESGPLFVSLSPRSKGDRLSRRGIRGAIKARMREAGVLGKSSHSLRHSAITAVLRGGGSLRQAQAMARHVDPKTTMIYVHELDRLEDPPEDLVSYD